MDDDGTRHGRGTPRGSDREVHGVGLDAVPAHHPWGRWVTALDGPHHPLGTDLALPATIHRAHLQRGVLLLYTDGITEARDRRGGEFGAERFVGSSTVGRATASRCRKPCGASSAWSSTTTKVCSRMTPAWSSASGTGILNAAHRLQAREDLRRKILDHGVGPAHLPQRPGMAEGGQIRQTVVPRRLSGLGEHLPVHGVASRAEIQLPEVA
ncbi:SpoIIE family protein phosphatase [Streptomyces sp. NPDC048550]|uniref:SpoIIE family protein phosphatase n=1 Tax=Streptomyces sp. NPDC048550 TaxID=3155739 RepID=UPI0034468F06